MRNDWVKNAAYLKSISDESIVRHEKKKLSCARDRSGKSWPPLSEDKERDEMLRQPSGV